MDTFLLLGDSLLQQSSSQEQDSTGQIVGSLGPRLANAYVRRLDVINRGFSGYNTRQVLSVLKHPNSLPRHARIAVVLLGANDARLNNTPGGPQQHVGLEEFKENLRQIVLRVAEKSTQVILVTPPPVDERMTVAADSKKHPELAGIVRRKAIVTSRYAKAVRQLGRELGEEGKNVRVLDFWGRMIELSAGEHAGTGVNGGDLLDGDYLDVGERKSPAARVWGENTCPGATGAPVNEELRSYLTDGLHLSRKGYDLLHDEIMALIKQHWPEQMPDSLPMVAPAWDDPVKWDEDGKLRDRGRMGGFDERRLMLPFLTLQAAVCVVGLPIIFASVYLHLREG